MKASLNKFKMNLRLGFSNLIKFMKLKGHQLPIELILIKKLLNIDIAVKNKYLLGINLKVYIVVAGEGGIRL